MVNDNWGNAMIAIVPAMIDEVMDISRLDSDNIIDLGCGYYLETSDSDIITDVGGVVFDNFFHRGNEYAYSLLPFVVRDMSIVGVPGDVWRTIQRINLSDSDDEKGDVLVYVMAYVIVHNRLVYRSANVVASALGTVTLIPTSGKLVSAILVPVFVEPNDLPLVQVLENYLQSVPVLSAVEPKMKDVRSSC
ncbi:MAG: hypothetical protein QXU32_11565 [Nitrososphaerales archaeon]